MKHSDVRASKDSKPTVLIVDDEPKIREGIAQLISESFDSYEASNLDEAIEIAKAKKPALILLDIVMPGADGIEGCKRLRSDNATRHIPVLMLSAAAHRANRIRSFESGADDFIAKPFDPEELLTRLHSKLRRATERKTGKNPLLVLDNLRVDQDANLVTVDGVRVQLTELEFTLLSVLVAKAGCIVTRKEILTKVWKNAKISDRSIDAHMVSLRKKIAPLRSNLETAYGRGYILRIPEQIKAPV